MDCLAWCLSINPSSTFCAVCLSSSSAAVEKPVKKSTTKKLDVLLSEDTEARQLLNQVTDYYHETLKQNQEALAYMEKRGLGDSELIDRFKLGYANRTLAYRLPEKNRKAGAEIRGKLQEVGVLRNCKGTLNL